MKAIFEVEFNTSFMCDKPTLKKEFNNSWYKYMKWLYKEEGIGIFSKPLRLKKILK